MTVAGLPLLTGWFREERDRLRAVGTSGLSPIDQIKTDPSAVMRLAGMEPDPIQAEALNCVDRQLMLLWSRQTGKSQTAAAMALATAIRIPNSDTLIVSRTQRQSSEMMRKVRELRRVINRPLASPSFSRQAPAGPGKRKPWEPRPILIEEITAADPIEAARDNVLSLELTNGSRIVALPGSVSGSADNVVGFSAIAMLILDEGARIRDEYYKSLRPVLAASEAKHGPQAGRLVVLSTPYGKRGWFYDIHTAWENAAKVWEAYNKGGTPRDLAARFQLSIEAVDDLIANGGDPGWRVFRRTYKDCPRIPERFIRQERIDLGPRWFRQEYEISFEDTTDAVFASPDIEALVDPAVEGWDLSAIFGGQA